MKIEINVQEAIDLFKVSQNQPKQLFEMNCIDVKETVGQYLTSLMNAELTREFKIIKEKKQDVLISC